MRESTFTEIIIKASKTVEKKHQHGARIDRDHARAQDHEGSGKPDRERRDAAKTQGLAQHHDREQAREQGRREAQCRDLGEGRQAETQKERQRHADIQERAQDLKAGTPAPERLEPVADENEG